jgi:hypothetical protein
VALRWTHHRWLSQTPPATVTLQSRLASPDFAWEVVDLVPVFAWISVGNPCGTNTRSGGNVDSEVKEASKYYVHFPFEEVFSSK